MIDLQIIREGIVYSPLLEGKVLWETERKETPGKLTFTVVKDNIINFQEGNTVNLGVNGTPLFHGYVFTKKRDKGNTISVTAYDQLRYLKNKDTYSYKNKKASDVVKMLCKDFRLNTGTIEDTGFVIKQRVEDGKTLFDMIQNALDDTLKSTKKLFVLYDDYGKITLKNIESMVLPNFWIQDANAGNFDYTTSIDSNTYNKIKLYYENEKTGKRDIYQALSSYSINNWGVLQHYESLKNPENGKAKATEMLGLYNRKSRQLRIKDVIGDIRVRAGTSIGIKLGLGDINVQNRFVAEKVSHTFENDKHLMDITVRGCDFSV